MPVLADALLADALLADALLADALLADALLADALLADAWRSGRLPGLRCLGDVHLGPPHRAPRPGPGSPSSSTRGSPGCHHRRRDRPPPRPPSTRATISARTSATDFSLVPLGGTQLAYQGRIVVPGAELRAGELGVPVAIHTGDPLAFFKPPTPDNERYEELAAHPSWSFYGADYPSLEEAWWRGIGWWRAIRRPPSWPCTSVAFPRTERGRAVNAPAPEPVGRCRGARPGDRPRQSGRLPRLLRRVPRSYLFGTDLAVDRRALVLGSGGDRKNTRPPMMPAATMTSTGGSSRRATEDSRT